MSFAILHDRISKPGQESAPRKVRVNQKIKRSTHTLVIVGKYANSYHPDREKIGVRNWQWWEINQSIAEGNRLVAVKIEKENTSPDPLLNAGAKWALSFTVDAVASALESS